MLHCKRVQLGGVRGIHQQCTLDAKPSRQRTKDRCTVRSALQVWADDLHAVESLSRIRA